MDVFKHYANFYDAIYENKDYLQECLFVKEILEKYSDIPVRSLLDLGCGTGAHAFHFADMGYTVTGIDLSKEMLSIANKKAKKFNKNIKFIQQDIRQLRLEQTFDTATSMFAVMGYLNTNEDIENTLNSINIHLKTDGIFIFDVWFGPAVLAQKPTDRLKIIKNKEKRIIRYAQPKLDIIDQIIKVDYLVIESNDYQILSETNETHNMRFFFYQEIKYLLEKNGFKLLKVCPFLSLNDEINDNCWNATIISKKV